MGAYEWNRVTGVSFGNADFHSAVKHHVKRGEFFKAYPTCFPHANAKAICDTLGSTEAANDVVLVKSGSCRLGVRVRISPYLEGIMAVWVMIAVCAENNS